MSERIQKLLANAGLGSRREIEHWIREGQIMVNGKKARLGDALTENEHVVAKGRRYRVVSGYARRRVVLYHKPVGEVCTRSDPEGRRSVYETLPRIQKSRWIGVGRLDINTAGLLLFTNDGELAHRLMHPSSQIEREYAVRVRGDVPDGALAQLSSGVVLDDGPAKFESIRFAGGEGQNRWYHVTLREGRNREVRKMWATQGVEVSRLIRVRFGSVALPRELRVGKRFELNAADVNKLAQSVQLPSRLQGAKGDGLKLVSEAPRTRRKRRRI